MSEPTAWERAAETLHRGNALARLGDREGALAAYAEAVRLDPQFVPEVLANVGELLTASGEVEAGTSAYEAALAHRPAFWQVACRLAYRYALDGRSRDAQRLAEAALQVAPDELEALATAGAVALIAGRHQDAYRLSRAALARDPGHVPALGNLAAAAHWLGALEEAQAVAARAIALAPDFAEAHYTLGLTLLAQGEYAAGWGEVAWRTKAFAYRAGPRVARYSAICPRWEGGGLEGKRVLIGHEQGFGDALLLYRYVPLLARAGAVVTLESPPELAGLAARLDGLQALRLTSDEPLPASEVDLFAPLLDLPWIAGTTRQTIPARVPYLHAPPEGRARWRPQLAANGCVRAGIVWRSAPQADLSALKSIAFPALAPLFAIPGIQWFSLQKGDDEAGPSSRPVNLTILGPGIADFADTAAILAELDLLVSVDTAAAHLAGALGRPAWVLVPKLGDWRWISTPAGRSCWHPSLRVVRQAVAGDWDEPIGRLAAELRAATLGGAGDEFGRRRSGP